MVPRPFSKEEISRLFAAANQMPGHVGAVEASQWWPQLLRTVWERGLRTAEALAIHPWPGSEASFREAFKGLLATAGIGTEAGKAGAQ